MNEEKKDFIKKITKKIVENSSPALYEHILNVKEVSFELLDYSVNNKNKKDDLEIAILLHDIAKYYSTEELKMYIKKYDIKMDDIMAQEEALWHGPVSAAFAKYIYKIHQLDILEAIYFHSIGKPNMSIIAKLLIIGDYLDASKKYIGYEVLKAEAKQNLDVALYKILTAKIEYVLKKGKLLHPMSVEARNFYLSLIKNV